MAGPALILGELPVSWPDGVMVKRRAWYQLVSALPRSCSRVERCPVLDVLKPAILTAGVPADMTFHDLRHTFASTALAEGVPISEVSRWLGHESITTTVDLYGHLVPEASERARTALNNAFAAELASRDCAPVVPSEGFDAAD
ncbi:tyrosine-type recombinase/integrase [Nonomuraea sp. NPDC023979]|uniref:tyrosine-type recombinase/integrase n=1 Tax=Nonomuraea sp. NPDC023979 TaxID=3154796 RepID=UPI0033DCD2FB